MSRQSSIKGWQRPGAPKPQSPGVRFRQRGQVELVTEQIFAEGFLRWCYHTLWGRVAFALLFNNTFAHSCYGRWQNRRGSKKAIATFVERFGIDASELELPPDEYPSFNAFFCRRLKPGARPFCSDLAVLVSPADGKVLVIPELGLQATLPVKGWQFSVAEILQDSALARHYDAGSALIVRLAPYDYHRFHFIDDGIAQASRFLGGEFHSVNPLALARQPGVYCRNRRMVSRLQSANFEMVACIEVGAFSVASIVQTYHPGAIRRGQEKGYFQFGGSTVILLFEPGMVQFDADLLVDSGAGIEVQVQAGSPIGRRR